MLDWNKTRFLMLCDVEWCDVEFENIHFKIKYENNTYIIKPDEIMNINENIQITYHNILEYIDTF